MKAINVGVASHITGASPNGPRYDASLTTEQRKSIDNGIWLCQKCGKLVDNDAARYPVEQLRKWKRLAENRAVLELEGGPRRPDTINAGIVVQGSAAINIGGPNAAHVERVSVLKSKRLHRLHKRFYRASEQFPFLWYIAATGQDNIPDWPRIPHHDHPGAESFGLTKGDWLRITGRPTGSVFTPLGNPQWLHFDDRLWQGTFYFAGKETNATNDEPHLLQQQYAALKGALEKFELLATEAAGLLAPSPSPHPLVDFPRTPDLWHRWVEELFQRACPEEPGLFSFTVRRIQFNVFQASAQLLEELETVGRDNRPVTSAAH